jgi:hypothetical protein
VVPECNTRARTQRLWIERRKSDVSAVRTKVHIHTLLTVRTYLSVLETSVAVVAEDTPLW